MDNAKLSIKNWDEQDRPREKLLAKGRKALSDAELIAILIGSGSRNETAVELARKIMQSAGNNLNALGAFSVNDLKKHKGIGEAKAVTIVSALEIGRRRKAADVTERKKITCSSDLFELFYSFTADLPHEEFWAVYLNSANKIIDTVNISSGGIAGTVADVRQIMKFGIEKLATAMAICHNHPSGNVNPSNADIQLTKKIFNAGQIMNIQLLDHIIVGDKNYFSFADENILT